MLPPHLPITYLLRLPQKPQTRPTTSAHPFGPHPRSFAPCSQELWDLSARRGVHTSHWTPGTLMISRRRKGYFPKERNYLRDFPLLNKKDSKVKINVQDFYLWGSVYKHPYNRLWYNSTWQSGHLSSGLFEPDKYDYVSNGYKPDAFCTVQFQNQEWSHMLIQTSFTTMSFKLKKMVK